MKHLIYSLLMGLLFMPGLACKEETASNLPREVYEGPVREAHNINMYYSEQSVKKTILTAPRLLEFKNGDREFPDGLFLEFYDADGSKGSELKANYAFYTKADNLWKATGEVEVKSLKNDQQLNSEELFWKPDEERIFTDKFVTIRLQKKLLYGNGLESNQEFTDYTIKNFKGDIELE